MLQQTYIINGNLKMSKGKIGAQTAHGAIFYMNEIKSRHCDDAMAERFHDWFDDGTMKKIVLKATKYSIYDLYELLSLKDIWCYRIFDLGLTQIPANSLTCLVVEPLPEEQCKTLFGHLKLL